MSYLAVEVASGKTSACAAACSCFVSVLAALRHRVTAEYIQAQRKLSAVRWIASTLLEDHQKEGG